MRASGKAWRPEFGVPRSPVTASPLASPDARTRLLRLIKTPVRNYHASGLMRLNGLTSSAPDWPPQEGQRRRAATPSPKYSRMRLLLSSGRRPDSGPKRTPAFAGVTGDRIGASIAGRHISVCSLRLFDAAADTHARPQPGTSTPQDRKNHYFIPATDKTVRDPGDLSDKDRM